ncbi:MAG TPA: hypothetical protein VEC99_05725 [Clostridia bacterium]|nr:hypothetical protein [Clostridia bacterium]
MAGEARSDAFMLGSATVMLGAQADLMNLTTDQSIGLVKNVTLKTTPGFTDLTQGVKNTLVYSVMTSNTTTVDGEVYEYTSKNLSYALGLDGSDVEATAVETTVGTEMTLTGDATGTTMAVAAGAGIAEGDYVTIQVGSADQVFVRKVTAVADNNVTISSGLPVVIPVGATVRVMNVLAVGSLDDQPYLSCKIVGTLANGDEVVLLLPKVRVTSGLSMGFKTDNFDNIPLQMQIYDLVATDPNYAMFQDVGPSGRPAKAMLLANK